MKINKSFLWKNNKFRSIVRLVSETVWYSERRKKWELEWKSKTYTIDDIIFTYQKYDLNNNIDIDLKLFDEVIKYLNFRSNVLELDIKPNLMNKQEAENLYKKMLKENPNTLNIHMNKQKWDKSHPNYLVNMVNIVANNIVWDAFDADPLKLWICSNEKWLLKTFPRRMDWAIPSINNPKIIREIKEYYNTTTFGSRIADGVYETMLVWEELKVLEREEWVKVHHVLFTDNYLTRWKQWKSYLCRFVDIVHMGLIDQVFFGREVYDKRPLYLNDILLPTK